MAISPADRLLNDGLASIGPLLSARDRRAIADWWDVDVRTVQRWFTSATEKRAFIYRTGQDARREWAEALLHGVTFSGEAVTESWAWPGKAARTDAATAVDFAQNADQTEGVEGMRLVRATPLRDGGGWYVLLEWHIDS